MTALSGFTRRLGAAGATALVAASMGWASPAAADPTYQRPDDPDEIAAGSGCTYFGRDHVVHADVRSLVGDGGTAPEAWDQWMVDQSLGQAPSIWSNKGAPGSFTVWGMPVLVTDNTVTSTYKVNVWNPTAGMGSTYLPSGSTRYFQGTGVINNTAPGIAEVKTTELRIKPAWKALPQLSGPWWNRSFSADKAHLQGDFPQNYSDRHMLVTDTTDCASTEFILAQRPQLFGNALSNGGYEFGAASGTEWDLSSNAIERGENNRFSGVDVPRNSIAAATVRREEISDAATPDGRNDDTPLDHALRFCMPAALIADTARWPAAASDGTNTTGGTDAQAPEMGSRVRLKASISLTDMLARPGGAGWDDETPVSNTNPTGPKAAYAEAIFTALQVHGMILSDSCVNNWSISGDPDSQWTNAELNALRTLRLSDFELVDAEPMRAVTGTLNDTVPDPTLESRWFEIK